LTGGMPEAGVMSRLYIFAYAVPSGVKLDARLEKAATAQVAREP